MSAVFTRRGLAVGMGVALVGAVLTACGSEAGKGAGAEAPAPDGLSLVSTLGGLDTAGYERALEVRAFDFPRDHGPHPGFRTEWWYVTGNLTAEGGREFGFHFTIFRSALAPTPPGGPSEWATNQAYMGHFAVTDVTGAEFRAFDLFARGSGGLAGARADPLRVWIEDWELAEAERDAAAPAAREARSGTVGDARSGVEGWDAVFPLRLRAEAGSEGGAAASDTRPGRPGEDDGVVAIDLLLEAGKPVVLQGERGLSQKGPEPGNASYYYAHTRMPAGGRVVFEGETYAVSGLAWMDREWSTAPLSPGQVGWDWFALQLDDGWEMMVYQLRREDGSPDPLSDGVLITPTGERIPLEWGTEVSVSPTGTWTSPVDGAEYPSGWRIRVPGRGWDLRVEPVVLDQELRLAFRYWEGSVRVEGEGEGGEPVQGRGYVELTGYAGAQGG